MTMYHQVMCTKNGKAAPENESLMKTCLSGKTFHRIFNRIISKIRQSIFQRSSNYCLLIKFCINISNYKDGSLNNI